MAIDKNPTPLPERPADPMTAADGAQLFTKLENFSKEIFTMMEQSNKKTAEVLSDLSNRLATTQRDVINMRDTVSAVSQDFAATRVQRLQQEIADQEKEKQILEQRIKVVNEKLEEKKTNTVSAINTTDRMKQAAEVTFEERERFEKEQRAAAWAKRRETILTAVMVSLSVGFVGSLVAAIWWFVMFYVNNR